ncbi:hypothetical protein MJL30_37920, partial [Salmonella enterica subsp. enterica serovar Anatum]|nr:hypothetical protein [Salmonella enterica subsp. enterica serovar Anatum]
IRHTEQNENTPTASPVGQGLRTYPTGNALKGVKSGFTGRWLTRLFANAQRHIAAVEALGDIQEVLDYDYSSGWQP